MAITLNDTKLHIAGLGYVFYAPHKTPYPNFTKFKMADAKTWQGWTFLGDTSGENVVEFEAEGGEIEYKRTWGKKKARAVRSDTKITGTINSVHIGKETFEVAFASGAYAEESKSYKVKDTIVERKGMVMIVMEDGASIAAIGYPNTTMTGSHPKFDLENFTEIPISVAVLADEELTLYEIFEPRDYNPA